MANDSLHIYVAERESNQYVTVLSDHELYLLENVSRKVAQKAIDAISAGAAVDDAMGAKAIVIPAVAVRKMTTAEHDDLVKVWYDDDGVEKKQTIAMDGYEEQLALMRAVASSSIPDATESAEPIPIIQAIIGPGLTSLAVIAITAVFLVLANDVAAGNPIQAQGRRRGMKILIAKVLDAIGATGVIAIGVLALCASLYWLYRRVQSPPTRTTIERPV